MFGCYNANRPLDRAACLFVAAGREYGKYEKNLA